jgi:HTH-type transcriptional regulator/antitoxin HigA
MDNHMSHSKPIRTRDQYEAALALIERHFDAKPGTAEEQVLEILASRIEAYEARRCPIDPPTPVEAVKFMMEQLHRS